MPTEMDVLRNRIEKGWPLTVQQTIAYLYLRGGEIAVENEKLDKETRERLEPEGSEDANQPEVPEVR